MWRADSPLTERYRQRWSGIVNVGKEEGFVVCASYPPVAVSLLFLLSFLSSDLLWCNPKASARAAAQRTSLPSVPLPFSKSLSLFSLHFQKHAKWGKAREWRALKYNWGLFSKEKRRLSHHISFCCVYCTMLQAVCGWGQWLYLPALRNNFTYMLQPAANLATAIFVWKEVLKYSV